MKRTWAKAIGLCGWVGLGALQVACGDGAGSASAEVGIDGMLGGMDATPGSVNTLPSTGDDTAMMSGDAVIPSGPMTMGEVPPPVAAPDPNPPTTPPDPPADDTMSMQEDPDPMAMDPDPMDPDPVVPDPMDEPPPEDDMMTPAGEFPEPAPFEGIVAAHNEVRAGLGEGLADLVWSQEAADVAQGWANTLAEDCAGLVHNPSVQGVFGENLAAYGASPGFPETIGADAVESWAAEVACWDYGTILGSEGCDAQCVGDLNSNGCGHYTQVVWANTQSVGCGFSTCTSGSINTEYWVCNYDPPGNFIGQAPY